jgi:hypothetical protein
MVLVESFIFFSLKFVLFFILFFLIGRGLLLSFANIDQIDKLRIAGFNIYIFYPALGIIIFGNFLFLINFFLPLNSSFVFTIFLLLIVNLKTIPTYEVFKKSFRNFLWYLFLLIPSYDLAYHYDAGLYHLNYQALLRENNIILGTSNIYGPYGIGSIYDYISAALWIDNTFVLLQFVNLIFIILFYEFLFSALFTKKNILLNNAGLALLIFSVLDNFGYGGGRNGFIYIQSLGKQDLTLAVLYFVTAVLIFLTLTKKEVSIYSNFIITIFSLFIFQLKVSGSSILLLYIYYLYKTIKNKEIAINFYLSLFPSIFLGIFWTLKSILQTGCIVYPLEISCLKNLSWFDGDYTEITLQSAQMFSISYSFDYSFNSWLNNFFEYQINQIIVYNFIISSIVIFGLFFKKNKSKMNSIHPLVLIIIFNIFFLLYFGPHMRYFISSQLLIIFLIGYIRAPRIQINSVIIYSTVVLSIFSLVRLNSYKSFDFFTHPNHEIPVPELVAYNDRFLPKDGDQCWSAIECSPNLQNFQIQDSGFYKKVLFFDN